MNNNKCVCVCYRRQEYVERSVTTFGSEATTVEGVCGRFRDLLTLRLQLLLKVNLALRQMHHARRELLIFVQVFQCLYLYLRFLRINRREYRF